MRSDGPLPVAIIGGGFSGTIAAAQLARRGIGCVLIEGAGRLARGAAYSTDEPAHLLNVRAGNMSAWADDSDDFVRFFADLGGEPGGFAERRLFGRYLERILAEAVAGGHVRVVEGKAVSARPTTDGWTIGLATGETLNAGAVVLAIGNQPPEPLPFVPSGLRRFVANPWGGEARAAVEHAAATDAPVLIVGTGLTMVDMVLSLDEAGHRSRIVALSRRGLVPRGHADFAASPVVAEEVPHGSLRSLVRWLRARSARVGWRAAVDSLRPHSQGLWNSLSTDEQRRFLRHARPWWDVHRHRIAPEVAVRVTDLVAQGRLEVVAGRIVELGEAEAGLAVRYRRRGRAEREENFAWAINCTGPLGHIGGTREPLLRQMLDDGLVRPDELGIGLEVDPRSRVAGAPKLWALGPMAKGRFWEIVAVPDIRVQAADVADDIATELGE